MRTYSFFVSMLGHAALLGAVLAASIVATDVLPEPRRALEYITVRPSPPPPVPPPAQNLPADLPPMLTFTPLSAPTGISPEPPLLDLSPPDPSIVTGLTTGLVPTGIVEPPSPPLPVAPIRVGGSRQWRFTPTLLNGDPVPVVMTVTVAFELN